MKTRVNFTQEVEVLSQELVSTMVISTIKINNNMGSLECACLNLSEAMHKDSEALNDRAYGSITPLLLSNKWASKTLEYWVRTYRGAEETVLMLLRNTYKYSK